MQPSLLPFFTPLGASSVSAAKAVGVGDFAVEDGVTLASMTSSSRASYSSSESLRMMILSSPGGMRRPRLRLPKSLLAKSSSHEVSRKRSSSCKERSTIRILLEGPPCSKTGERWRHEEASGGDPNGASGRVKTLLDNEEPSFEGEQGCLVPLLSSIVVKRRRSEENPKRKSEEVRDGHQRKMKEVYMARKASRSYRNGHHFYSHAPT
jgi:hypothetical protein